MRTAAELTLGREPDAVPKARRFVGWSLGGEEPGTVHSVQLAVTELVTNAMLHGRPPVLIRLIHLGRSIRVEVEDSGQQLPVLGIHDPDAMTGRGLAVVAALSSAWGIDAGRGKGKVVWAQLPVGAGPPAGGTPSGDGVPPARGDRPAVPASPEITPEAVLASQSGPQLEPTYTVRLPGVPTSLLLAAKAHIDSIVRELTLLAGGEKSRGVALAPAMARVVQAVTDDFAYARADIKRQALAAAGRGDRLTDLELHLPLSYAEAGESYLAALDEADLYARSERLLTLAPPLSHRAFRRWYVSSLVEQLRALGAGRVPDPPEPLPTVLAARLDELEETLRRASDA